MTNNSPGAGFASDGEECLGMNAVSEAHADEFLPTSLHQHSRWGRFAAPGALLLLGLGATLLARKPITNEFREVATVMLDDDMASGRDSCQCIGIRNRTGHFFYKQGKTNLSADFGAYCSRWDLFTPTCTKDEKPDWCRKKWCYVDPCKCKLKAPPRADKGWGIMFQGGPIYWSYETCGEEDGSSNEAEMKRAKKMQKALCKAKRKGDWDEKTWGNKKCKCRGYSGISGEIEHTNFSYPGDVGSKCAAWDKDVNPSCLVEEPPVWCSKKWCYVDPCRCKQEKIGGAPTRTEGTGYYAASGNTIAYSYETCGEMNAYSAHESDDLCPRKKGKRKKRKKGKKND